MPNLTLQEQYEARLRRIYGETLPFDSTLHVDSALMGANQRAVWELLKSGKRVSIRIKSGTPSRPGLWYDPEDHSTVHIKGARITLQSLKNMLDRLGWMSSVRNRLHLEERRNPLTNKLNRVGYVRLYVNP